MIKSGIYKHIKSGNLYKVLGTGKCSETLENKVVYQELYGDCNVWVRPEKMWTENRFKPFSLSELDYHYDKIALLAICDRKVLMARSKGKQHFYMPGGKREIINDKKNNPLTDPRATARSETDMECLVRECREELNIDVDPNSAFLYGVYSAFAYKDKPCAQLTIYQARFKGTPTPSNEIEEIGWLTYADREKAVGSGRTLMDELYWKGLID